MQQMVGLRDSVAPLAGVWGIPTVRSLILRKRFASDTEGLVTEFVEITPRVHIDTVSPRLANAFQSSIQIEIDDFQVSGISRSYSRSDLVGTSIAYFVDGVLTDDGSAIASGIECDFIAITESSLTWDLILRRKADDRDYDA